MKGSGRNGASTGGVVEDYALVGETSGFAIAQAECGAAWFKIRVKGREVYTSRLGNVMLRVVLRGEIQGGHMSRNKLTHTFCSLWLSFLVTQTAARAEVIRIGIPGLSAEFTPVWAAKDRGRLKKYDLDVEIIAMQGGTQLVQAMVGSSIDFAVMGGAFLTGAVKGADLVMVATHMDKFPYSLVVRPMIKRPEDLKGTKLAISRFGSSSDAGLRVALQRSGLNPDKDVTILQVGGQTARYAALKAGAVDGTVVIPPLSSAAQRGGYNVIINMTKLGLPFPQEGVVASRQYIANRRDTLLRFMKGFLEAVKDIKTDKEFAIATISKHLRMDPKKDRQALEDSFQEVVLEQMLKVPHPSLEAVKAALDLLEKERPSKASADPRDYVDGSLMLELEKTGFIQNLWK